MMLPRTRASSSRRTSLVWVPRSLAVLALLLALAACGQLTSEPPAAPAPPPPPSTPTSQPLWTADMETGTLDQWYGGAGGGEFNSGTGTSTISSAIAHTGRYSVLMTIDAASGTSNGTRLFRWKEPSEKQALYYSGWYYFPQVHQTPSHWWNIMQWKAVIYTSTPNVYVANDPFYIIDVGNRADGTMYLQLTDWQTQTRWYAPIDLPTQRWVHIEAYYLSRGDATGAVRVWQDGHKVFDLANVQTRYQGSETTWSIDNYSDILDPAVANIYLDDVAISTSPVGTLQ